MTEISLMRYGTSYTHNENEREEVPPGCERRGSRSVTTIGNMGSGSPSGEERKLTGAEHPDTNTCCQLQLGCFG